MPIFTLGFSSAGERGPLDKYHGIADSCAVRRELGAHAAAVTRKQTRKLDACQISCVHTIFHIDLQ